MQVGDGTPEFLEKELSLWRDHIEQLIRTMPTAAKDEIAWNVVEAISISGASLLHEIFLCSTRGEMVGSLSRRIQRNS